MTTKTETQVSIDILNPFGEIEGITVLVSADTPEEWTVQGPDANWYARNFAEQIQWEVTRWIHAFVRPARALFIGPKPQLVLAVDDEPIPF